MGRRSWRSQGMAKHRRPSWRWPFNPAERARRATPRRSRGRDGSRWPARAAHRALAALRSIAAALAGHDHAHHANVDDGSRSRVGVRAALGSGALLALVLAAQLAIYQATDSSALLSDAVHNLGDALTALPVAAALLAPSEAWERRA